MLARRILALGFMIILLPAVCAAQSAPPLVTDRPDQTESTVAVSPGLVQIELGGVFSRAHDSDNDAETLTLGSALVRIGLLSALEARIGFAGWERTEAASAAESGVGSIELGFKYQFKDENGFSPGVAILAGAALPFGTEGIRSLRVDPTARLALSHALSDRVGIGYNIGLSMLAVDTGARDISTETEGVYTFAVGIGLTDLLGMFLEAFGTLAVSDSASSAHLLDAGFTYLAADIVQLDVSGGVRYAGDAEDWFIGVGVSLRVPR